MIKLTLKEQEVFAYIVQYYDLHKYPCTIAEIAKDLYTSRSYARECVEVLYSQGYIVYNPSKHRTITPIEHIA